MIKVRIIWINYFTKKIIHELNVVLFILSKINFINWVLYFLFIFALFDQLQIMLYNSVLIGIFNILVIKS